MSDKIYIVLETSGYGDDYSSIPVIAFHDKAKADEMLPLIIEESQRLHTIACEIGQKQYDFDSANCEYDMDREAYKKAYEQFDDEVKALKHKYLPKHIASYNERYFYALREVDIFKV